MYGQHNQQRQREALREFLARVRIMIDTYLASGLPEEAYLDSIKAMLDLVLEKLDAAIEEE